MKKQRAKYLFLGIALGIFLFTAILGGAAADRLWGLKLLDRFVVRPTLNRGGELVEKEIINEESVITRVVEEAAPSVVTVSISKMTVVGGEISDLFPLGPFGLFNLQPKKRKIEQNIGTGFVVDSKEGLIVTNKHVIIDVEAEYKVISHDDKVYEIKKIYRDPVNDLAILKVESSELSALELGDSDGLKVGQLAIAIGTALGEFRHTVTTGVISGLGRGIAAGSPFEGQVEQLDNVIQTDAAINLGNSGGPLLDSNGQAIGVNVAVAREGENIGFAIPINVVKESLNNFRTTGEFNRSFFGVRYQMISEQAAILNEVPQGAYIREVIEDSPARKAGLEETDIITHIDNEQLDEKNSGLAKIINQKKVGQQIEVRVWREGERLTFKVILETRN